MKIYPLILSLFLSYNFSIAQCEIKTQRVTVFKDATVFIEKNGVCDIDNKSIIMDIPYQDSRSNTLNAYGQRNTYVKNHIVLGTLEVESPGNKIISTRSVKVTEEKDFGTLQQIFNNNKGKKVKLSLKNSKESVKGHIYNLESSMFTKNNLSVKTLVLQKDKKWIFVNLDDIISFEFLEDAVLINKIPRDKLLLSFEDNAKDQAIKVSYLQKGITWTPNYFINIIDEENLELFLKANVVNDITDLENAELNLAVGIPVFKYAPVGDPIFSNQRVIELITSMNKLGEVPKSPMTNVIMSQVSSGYVESYGNNVSPQLEGQSKDDIYLYKLNDVTLDKNERINLEILKMESIYKNIYVANLASNESIVTSNRNKKQLDNINVWHALKFDNTTGMPLTTGTVFFKKKDLNTSSMTPVSQGQLNFTPIGKHSIVKKSVSPNILILDSDAEVSREKNPNGYGHLVNVEAEFEVNNFKDEAIEMLVTREIRSTALTESSQTWEVIKSSRSLYDQNQNNLVKWNFTVPANGKEVIKYRYQVLVR